MPLPSETPDTGIVSASPVGFAPTPVQTIRITDPAAADIAVDTKVNPLASLMQHVQGSSWTVEYYSQVIDTDTPLTAQSVTLSPTYQQYVRVRDLELKVKTPIHPQQDDVTKMMTADGDAYVFVGGNALIPNEGDVIVADIGVGPLAVFRVSATEKLSYFKDAVYQISYALVSTDEEYFTDLEAKTVKDLTYRADFLTNGQNPLIQTEEVASLDDLAALIARLTRQYFKNFFSLEFKTLIIPGQNATVYDPFLTDFIHKALRPEDTEYWQHMRVLNGQDDVVFKQDNFWTAILERDASYLESGFTKIGLVYSAEFRRSPWNAGLRYSGVDCVAYPLDPQLGVLGLRQSGIKTLVTDAQPSPMVAGWIPWWDAETDYSPPNAPTIADPVPVLVDTPGAVPMMYPPLNTAGLNVATQNGVPTAIYPVLRDEYYVLGADFYTQTTTQSLLEAATWAYLKRESLDTYQLSQTASLIHTWGVLEKFYYTPLLIVLMRAYLRSYQG